MPITKGIVFLLQQVGFVQLLFRAQVSLTIHWGKSSTVFESVEGLWALSQLNAHQGKLFWAIFTSPNHTWKHTHSLYLITLYTQQRHKCLRCCRQTCYSMLILQHLKKDVAICYTYNVSVWHLLEQPGRKWEVKPIWALIRRIFDQMHTWHIILSC